TNSTTYTVTYIRSGCASLPQSVNVIVTEFITLNPNINSANVCPGSPYPTITITPSHLGGTYLWSTGATTNSITPTAATNYTVSYSATGCNTAVRIIPITDNNCDFSQNSCGTPNELCTSTSFTYPNSTNKPNLGNVGC